MKNNIQKILLGMICSMGLIWPHFTFAKPWIEWDSPDGLSRTRTASYTYPSFWKIIRYYESQRTLTYCGVASAVMVLNSLDITSPWSKLLGQYRPFSQEEFFSRETDEIVSRNEVEDRGLSLEKLAAILRKFPLKVTAYQGKHLSHEQIRSLIIPALKDPNQRVIALYQRQVIEQEGGGHWSPLAAYHVDTDSFLLLDVARFKYAPLWVDGPSLLKAMQTQDVYEQLRGFVIVEKLKK